MVMRPVERSLFENICPRTNHPLAPARARLSRQFGQAAAQTGESLSEVLNMAAAPGNEIFVGVPAVDVRPDQTSIRLTAMKDYFSQVSVNVFVMRNVEDDNRRPERL
jgi:hypothetical protein